MLTSEDAGGVEGGGSEGGMAGGAPTGGAGDSESSSKGQGSISSSS